MAPESFPEARSTDLAKRIERVRRDHPSLDERLQRYREARRNYDASRGAGAPKEEGDRQRQAERKHLV